MITPQIGNLYIFRPRRFIVECVENPLGEQVTNSAIFAGKTVHEGTLGSRHPIGSVSVTLNCHAFDEIDWESAQAIMRGAKC